MNGIQHRRMGDTSLGRHGQRPVGKQCGASRFTLLGYVFLIILSRQNIEASTTSTGTSTVENGGGTTGGRSTASETVNSFSPSMTQTTTAVRPITTTQTTTTVRPTTTQTTTAVRPITTTRTTTAVGPTTTHTTTAVPQTTTHTTTAVPQTTTMMAGKVPQTYEPPDALDENAEYTGNCGNRFVVADRPWTISCRFSLPMHHVIEKVEIEHPVGRVMFQHSKESGRNTSLQTYFRASTDGRSFGVRDPAPVVFTLLNFDAADVGTWLCRAVSHFEKAPNVSKEASQDAEWLIHELRFEVAPVAVWNSPIDAEDINIFTQCSAGFVQATCSYPNEVTYYGILISNNDCSEEVITSTCTSRVSNITDEEVTCDVCGTKRRITSSMDCSTTAEPVLLSATISYSPICHQSLLVLDQPWTLTCSFSGMTGSGKLRYFEIEKPPGYIVYTYHANGTHTGVMRPRLTSTAKLLSNFGELRMKVDAMKSTDLGTWLCHVKASQPKDEDTPKAYFTITDADRRVTTPEIDPERISLGISCDPKNLLQLTCSVSGIYDVNFDELYFQYISCTESSFGTSATCQTTLNVIAAQTITCSVCGSSKTMYEDAMSCKTREIESGNTEPGAFSGVTVTQRIAPVVLLFSSCLVAIVIKF